jgi:hypothetical protein
MLGKTSPGVLVLAFLGFVASPAARAVEHLYLAQYSYPSQTDEFKEKFRSGNCEVEREQKAGGKYKLERKCKTGQPGFERKEKYRDGPCKIEREWKDRGEYKEKVECERS